MSRDVLILTASPSATSRSTFVARQIAAHAERNGFSAHYFAPGDFDAADLIFGRGTAPAAVRFLDAVAKAEAIVLATPVYKATYSGALKTVVDLIPPEALVGKHALGVATTRLPAHRSEVDRAYQSLFAFFRARPAETLVVLDEELQIGEQGGTLTPAAELRIARAAQALVAHTPS
jgi:FMN reductase